MHAKRMQNLEINNWFAPSSSLDLLAVGAAVLKVSVVEPLVVDCEVAVGEAVLVVAVLVVVVVDRLALGFPNGVRMHCVISLLSVQVLPDFEGMRLSM